MGDVVLYESPADPLALYRMKLVVLEQTHKALFSKSDWNAIVRAGLYEGGLKWLVDYLPLRFNDGYARSQLGYQGKSGKTVDKMVNGGHAGTIHVSTTYGRGDAMVETGALERTATSESWAEARATSGNAQVTLHIATGMTPPNSKGGAVPYAANAMVYQILTSVTDREIGVIAKTMETTIVGLCMGSATTISRKGFMHSKLSKTQKQTITQTVNGRPLASTTRAA